MKAQSAPYGSLLKVAVLAIWLASAGTAGLATAEEVPTEVAPSVLHQQLAEAKAQSLADRQVIRKLSAADRLEDTQYNYDVKFYDVFIRVNDTTEILYGVVTCHAEAAVDGVTSVQVDFASNMVIDSIVSPSGPLAYSRLGDVVTVELGEVHDTGDPFEFTIGYNGHPLEGGFMAFEFTWRNGIRVISSLSEPYYARTWWPCKDRMDDKPDSMDIAIEVDSTFYCGSNGTLDSVVNTSANTDTYYYRVRYPMTTYLFSVAISEYTVWSQQYYYNGGADSMPVVHAVYPDMYSQSLTTWGNTPHYIEVLADKFGPYPFLEEKYGHANFDWGGAMEHQTMTSMGGSAFYWSIIVHELAHQWWGDMITCKSWQDIWLNEGWASYGEAVYQLEDFGWTAYRNYMSGMEYAGGGTIYVDDTTQVWRIFHGGLSYDKGAWVVHMLRGVLGEELYQQGVDAYYDSEYKFAAANTEEFKNVWETATGVELNWFFDEWIHGTYRPNYYWHATSVENPGGGHDIYILIEQVQTTDPRVFTMPVEFLLDFQSIPDDTVTCFVDQREQLFKFHYSDALDTAYLDPAYWILKYETAFPWGVQVVTLQEELSDGLTYIAYEDTLTAIGGSGQHTFTLSAGNLPPGLSLSPSGIISGNPTDIGDYTFTVLASDQVEPLSVTKQFTIDITYQCCGQYTAGYTGNVDRDASGYITLSDISQLIDHLYISRESLPCETDGNVNGSPDGKVTLSDVTRLIDHVYISKLPTEPCQ